MAKFTITRTSATLPGQTAAVPGRLDFDTGQQAIVQAGERLGGTMFQVGSTLNRIAAQSELADAMADNKETMRGMFEEFESNPDPDSYDSIFRETFNAEVKGRKIRNPLARREYRLAMPDYEVQMRAGVVQAKRQQTVKNFQGSLTRQRQEAVKTGNPLVFDRLLDGGVSANLMTADEAEAEKESVRTNIEEQVAADLAWRDPDTAIAMTPDEFAKRFPRLGTKRMSWFVGQAMHAKSAHAREQDELTDGIINDVLLKARTMNFAEFRTQLEQTPNLTEVHRTELMKVYLNAAQLWQNTGVNPWEKTQDPASLAQTIIDIERTFNWPGAEPYEHRVMSDEDINNRWLEGGNGPRYSIDDMQMLKRLRRSYLDPKDENKYSPSHPIAHAYFTQLISAYQIKDKGDNEIIDPKRRGDFGTKYKMLERILKDNWDNPQKMDAEFEALMEPIRRERARGWFASMFPDWEAIRETGGTVNLAGSRFALPTAQKQLEPGKPTSAQEFIDTVARLKATDPDKAKVYYDQWKDQF